MEKKRKTEVKQPAEPTQTDQAKPARKYRREQILGLAQYRKRTDLLMALLRPEMRYTLDEVDRKIDDFMKRRA